MLFIILLDFILRKIDTIECGIEWTVGKSLPDLDYADDICLLASNVEETQRMVGTIVMEDVNNFMYLGPRRSDDGDKRAKINVRIGKSSCAFNYLKNMWKEDRISLATKLKLLNAIVKSVL